MYNRNSSAIAENAEGVDLELFKVETVCPAQRGPLSAVTSEERQDRGSDEYQEDGAEYDLQRASGVEGADSATCIRTSLSGASTRSDYPIRRVLENRMQQLPAEVLILRQQALVWANQMTWGRRGQTFRALTGALIVRMSLDGKECFHSSFRESADISQRSRSAVQEAIRDFRAWEFIVWRGTTSQHAHIWQFGTTIYDIELPSYASRIVNPCELFTDAAEPGALGMDGVRVWQTLWQNGRLRRWELSLLCGLGMGQTDRLLRRLANRVEGFPLVEKLSDGRLEARGPDDPTIHPGQWLDDHVARPLGYLGARQRRILRHDRERALYGIR